ncbi:MAG: glycosyltransferase family 4 protein [Acidimicrobiales bacterium]
MEVHICTIAARNYLPFVRTLATSFREVHPDGRVSALIFDDIDCVVGPGEPFEVVRLADLGEDVGELHRMAMIYDVTEFATALKPWLLETLLGCGSEAVLYLDPDIQVFSSLHPLAEATVANGIALTPHVDTPFPLDGRKTEDRAILAAGIYNLGFIGVAATAEPFLRYWKERLRRECRLDPQNMRFVDQRWIDFVPGLFDHVIVREPQYNVAYWNLHGRTLVWTGAGYEVNGRPLAFYHFSGYSPFAPHLLSKHQGDRPRILLSEHPDLSRLCEQYAELLLRNGATATSGPDYGFGHLADGTPIDPIMRTLYRDWLEQAEDAQCSELPPDPFERAGAAELIVRLNEAPGVAGDPGRLTRYLAALYASRPDLQAGFPDPQWTDHDRFMEAVVAEASNGDIPALLARDPTPRQGEVDSAVLPVAGSVAGEWAPGDRLRPGIIVAGYLNAELGIGEGARLTVEAVAASGIPFATVGFRATDNRQFHPFSDTGANARDLDTNIVVVNADQFARFAVEAGPRFFAGRYTIAQWAWELEEFPRPFWPVLDLVSEVWAVSEFARSAIAAVTDKPVLAFPHPIVPPVVDEHIDRAALGLPEGFVFLFCFDLFSIFERKNPLGLIEAFCRAFAPGEGPTLVLKVINGDTCLNELEHLRWATRGRKDIVLLADYLQYDEQAALMALCDCYVSLHRSEGFGLTMAEAMALGKPVIATAYSGNLDFMDESTAYLVPVTMTSVPKGCDPYPVGARWAEPDLDEAARLMRAVVDHPDDAAVVGKRARQSVLANHGVERRAEFVRRRFDEIQRKRAALIQVDRTHSTRDPSQRSRPRRFLAGARSAVERLAGSEGRANGPTG